ncbi:hypothetical protein GJ496_001685 [Pomphorhynchus laevis]|nr:hypothetical protein GJ496_001685 [Pomphorhynchus laevis]
MGINTSNSYSVVLKLDDMRQNRIFVGGETVSGAAIITVSSKCTIPANAMQLILSSKLTYYETKIPQNDTRAYAL